MYYSNFSMLRNSKNTFMLFLTLYSFNRCFLLWKSDPDPISRIQILFICCKWIQKKKCRTGDAYNEVLKIQYITFKRWQSKGPCRGGNWQQKPRRQRATEWRGSSSFQRRSRLVRIRIKCCQDSASCHRVRLEPGGATGSFARLGEILGRRSGGGWRSGVLTLPPPPHSQAGLTPGRFSFFFCFCFNFAFQFQRGIAHRCTIFLC